MWLSTFIHFIEFEKNSESIVCYFSTSNFMVLYWEKKKRARLREKNENVGMDFLFLFLEGRAWKQKPSIQFYKMYETIHPHLIFFSLDFYFHIFRFFGRANNILCTMRIRFMWIWTQSIFIAFGCNSKFIKQMMKKKKKPHQKQQQQKVTVSVPMKWTQEKKNTDSITRLARMRYSPIMIDGVIKIVVDIKYTPFTNCAPALKLK